MPSKPSPHECLTVEDLRRYADGDADLTEPIAADLEISSGYFYRMTFGDPQANPKLIDQTVFVDEMGRLVAGRKQYVDASWTILEAERI